MANTSRPSGFRPIRHLSGSPWNGAYNIYYHSTANASAIYKGALVYSDSALGSPTCGPDPLGMYQSVCVTPDGKEGSLGVAIGFGSTPQLLALSTNLNSVNYCPASIGMYLAVVDDPTVIYEIEGNSGTWVSSNIGDNTDTSNNAAGSETTGRSSCVADHADLADTALQMRILRVVNRPDNEVGAYCKLEVMLNERALAGNMGAYATT